MRCSWRIRAKAKPKFKKILLFEKLQRLVSAGTQQRNLSTLLFF